MIAFNDLFNALSALADESSETVIYADERFVLRLKRAARKAERRKDRSRCGWRTKTKSKLRRRQ